MGTRSLRNARGWLVGLGLPTLLFAVGLASVFPFTIDDSYISLRYASNLAAGDGLVFNPGGPHVEGYTNLLLVLIEAALIEARIPGLVGVKVFLCCCGIALLATVVAYGRLRLREEAHGGAISWLPVLAAALIATSSPVILWTVGGLETVLFALLVTAGAAGHSLFLTGRLRGRKLYLVDLAWLLAILTRPEGLLFWLLTLGHTVVLGFASRDFKPIATRLPGILSSVLAVAAYASWKLYYFGSLVPVTYLAKGKAPALSTFLGGAARLLGFLAINGNFFLAVALVTGAAVLWRQKGVRFPSGYLVTLMSAYLAYVLSLGFRTTMDDAYRFCVPLVPLASLLLIEVGACLRERLLEQRTAVAAATLVALTFLLPLRVYDLWYAWRIDMNWGVLNYQIPAREVARGLERGHVSLGRWLEVNAPRDAVIVLSDVGAIPYFSGLHTIDTWSLTDPFLVRSRRLLASAEGEDDRRRVVEAMRSYVLASEPDYIVQDQLGLLDDPAVQARYRPLGKTFLYLDSYPCRRQGVCRSVLEPYVRVGGE